MKNFIKKIAQYSGILLVFIIIINYIYIQRDSKSIKFLNIPDQVQVCNFGSSHGLYGYNYVDVEMEYVCFNFALDSQSLSYDYRILYTYQDKIAKGAIVFIDISYFAPYGIPETEYESFESKNQRYYLFLPENQIKNYKLKVDLSKKFRSLSVGPLNIGYRLLRPVKIDDYGDYWLRTADMIDVEADAQAAYRRHCVEGKVDDDGELIYNEEEMQALHDMITLCRDLEATPILVTAPYLSEYIDAISEGSPKFLDEFYSWINMVAQKENVQYYDYSKDIRFSSRYDLFINADHLNKEGARQFTDILICEVMN